MNRTFHPIPHITLLQTFAVLSVILGHALCIYGDSWYLVPLYPAPAAKALHHFIYAFHMPLFFFLSGYLFAVFHAKQTNPFKYISQRFKRLVIPYYLIGFFYYIPMIWLIAPFADSSYAHISKIYYHFTFNGHLWFLITLFTAQSFYALLQKLPLRYKNSVLFLITLVCYFKAQAFSLPPIMIQKAMENLIFIHLGYIFAIKSSFFKTHITFQNLLALTPLFLGSILYLPHLPKLFTTFVFITYFYTCAQLLSRYYPDLHQQKYIKFIATNMFAIYILHEPFTIGLLKILDYGHKFSPSITVTILFVSTLSIVSLIIKFYKQIQTQYRLNPTHPVSSNPTPLN